MRRRLSLTLAPAVTHLEIFNKTYLVIVAVRPPSPSPSTRLVCSILVFNLHHLALAKLAIIDLFPVLAFASFRLKLLTTAQAFPRAFSASRERGL